MYSGQYKREQDSAFLGAAPLLKEPPNPIHVPTIHTILLTHLVLFFFFLSFSKDLFSSNKIKYRQGGGRDGEEKHFLLPTKETGAKTLILYF
jgi:hypothetical protein